MFSDQIMCVMLPLPHHEQENPISSRLPQAQIDEYDRCSRVLIIQLVIDVAIQSVTERALLMVIVGQRPSS